MANFKLFGGVMFGGKTKKLVLEGLLATIYGRLTMDEMLFISPSINHRYGKEVIATHDGFTMKAKEIEVEKAIDILDMVNISKTQLVLIDEIQFFDDEIVAVVEQLLRWDINVIAAGLTYDFRGEYFGPMQKLEEIALEVVYLKSKCAVCGAPAPLPQRLINGEPAHYNDPIIMVGGSESYEPRCKKCHIVIKD